MDYVRLHEEYPFLRVRGLDDNVIINDDGVELSYYDDVLEGWRELFMTACKQVKARLEEIGGLDTYRITQVKEKFGTLRVYDNILDIGDGEAGVSNIWYRVERDSAKICVECGKPAELTSVGWISPYCTECADRHSADGMIKFEPLRD